MAWLLCSVLAVLAINFTVGIDIDKKCYADIAFVVDTSSSISERDFNTQKAFMKDLVRHFVVGAEDVQFAAVSYGAYVYDEFKFNKNADQDSVIEDIGDIEYSEGRATRTYLAIDRMLDYLFASGNGARDDTDHVGIILTDGTTNPGGYDRLSSGQGKAETQKQAQLARNDNISLFAIGIGQNVNMDELQGIATDPDDKFVFKFDSYDKLNTEGVKETLFNRICSLVPAPGPIVGPTNTSNIPQGEDPKEECQGKPADIFFLLDESSSIHTVENFQLELSFVEQVVDYLDVGDDLTHVGLITFSSNATIHFRLNTFTTKDEVISAVKKIDWNGGNTYTDEALKMLMNEGFAVGNGARKGVAQIGIIVTDGNSTDPYKTRTEAELVLNKGIYMFAIGVGSVSRTELEFLASDPKSDFVFTVDSLEALSTIKQLLAYRVCKEKPMETLQEICRLQVADIAFILDSSSGIGPANFDELVDFISQVVSNFDIGSDCTRVGLITFADEPKIEFSLDSYTKSAQVENALSKVQFTSGQRNTELAIQMMTDNIFEEDSSERGDVPKIGIVITGGNPHNLQKTYQVANAAQKTGIHMIAIGVGKNVADDQLRGIASDSNSYYTVGDYSELDSILRLLTTHACREGKKKSVCKSEKLNQKKELGNKRREEERRKKIETMIDILRRNG